MKYLISGVMYSNDGRVFTVAVPGKGKAVFDMKKKVRKDPSINKSCCWRVSFNL